MKYSNSEMNYLIDEYVHNKVWRNVLKRRLIDGVHYEPLAEEFGYSVSQIKRIVYKASDELFKHINVDTQMTR